MSSQIPQQGQKVRANWLDKYAGGSGCMRLQLRNPVVSKSIALPYRLKEDDAGEALLYV